MERTRYYGGGSDVYGCTSDRGHTGGRVVESTTHTWNDGTVTTTVHVSSRLER